MHHWPFLLHPLHPCTQAPPPPQCCDASLPWKLHCNECNDRSCALAESPAYDSAPGELMWQTSGRPHQLHIAPASKQPPPSGPKKKEGVIRRRKDPSSEQASPAGMKLLSYTHCNRDTRCVQLCCALFESKGFYCLCTYVTLFMLQRIACLLAYPQNSHFPCL